MKHTCETVEIPPDQTKVKGLSLNETLKLSKYRNGKRSSY